MADRSNRHLDRSALRAALTGAKDLQSLLRRMLAHLVELCPVCAAEVAALLPRSDGQVSAQVRKELSRHAQLFEESHDAAEAELRDLLRLPPEKRLPAMHRARKRYRNAVLPDLLISESRRAVHSDPQAGYELADLAFEACLRIPLPGRAMLALFNDLLVRSLAAKVNGARALGHFFEAEAILAKARYHAESNPDPLTHAELLSTEASLRTEQRRFPEALQCLNRARDLYDELNDEPGLLRVTLKVARIEYQAGDPGSAARILLAVRDSVPAQGDRLALAWHHNLSTYLCDAGRFGEALQVQRDAEPLYAACPDELTTIRRRWLGARIAGGLGDTAAALSSLAAVRDGFIAQGQPLDAAIATLDLAALHAEAGDPLAVARLAAASYEVFTSHGIQAEALAALLLFHRAAEARALTAEQIRAIADKLRRQAQLTAPSERPS